MSLKKILNLKIKKYHTIMSKETIDKMFENVDRLEEKIKKIKRIEDYGINYTNISESIIYPNFTDMKQDI
jgi:hypothetical protein